MLEKEPISAHLVRLDGQIDILGERNAQPIEHERKQTLVQGVETVGHVG